MPDQLSHRQRVMRLSAALATILLTLQIAIAPAAPVAAAPAGDDEGADPYLTRLLGAINERRDRNGTQHLALVPASANAALDAFFAEMLPDLRWPGPCVHHLVGGAFSWDFVTAAGFGGAPRGEVLACPGPEPYWTPDLAAERWWESPVHFRVLYADGASNTIACSAFGAAGDENEGGTRRKVGGPSEAASAVICVTFQS